jgi:mono/diheme cytochrome c family protein
LAERQTDPQLESSTNRWMVAGVVLTVLLFLAFPVFRFYEPANRAEAREVYIESMVAQGDEIFAANCASCHGATGEGVDAPALNSQQFLSSAADEQISSIITHGIPGTEMSAYSLDFGGFLTAQQINAITAFLRSLEEDAPDRPDWRFPDAGHDEEEEEPGDGHDDEEEEPGDGHDDEEEEAGDGHDEDPEVVEEPEFVAEEAYAASCAECHGADLSGLDGPALGPTSHSLTEPDEHLIEAITFGRDEMPAFIEKLTEEQIVALVAYIREVQAAG